MTYKVYENEKKYRCDYPGCGVMRTKAEGGAIFTVCDKHWNEYFRNSQESVESSKTPNNTGSPKLNQCASCEDILNHHDEYNYCPYCGTQLRASA